MDGFRACLEVALSGRSAQRDEWIVCLKPAMTAGNTRDDEQATPPEAQ